MKIYIKSSKEFDRSKFSKRQLGEIDAGLPKEFIDSSIPWRAMKTIRQNWNKFEEEQMEEVREGLKAGLDVSEYADPKFDWRQMWEIRLGLEEGLDISEYADPKFDWEQMWEIREGLSKGLDVSQYANPEFDEEKMNQIRWELEEGLE